MSFNRRLTADMNRRVLRAVLMSALVIVPMSLAACSQPPKTEQTTNVDQTDPNATAEDDSDAMGAARLGPADEKFDLRFIDAMILHHEGAIAMAQDAMKKTTREEIKQFAQSVIDRQQQEIDQLKEWRQTWYADAGAEPVIYSTQMKETVAMSEEQKTAAMMQKRLGKVGDRFDSRFMRIMMPHHREAVLMARQALRKAEHPELKELAQTMIDSQNQDIQQLREWLKAWYGAGN
jgi:uncharacterized protein (DUF305 family)